MKTRIVYPQLWLDDKFTACSIPTKLLFSYLINNLQLGLSRYLHITDRQIMFDTGLTVNQLETGKKELAEIKWCFFTDNWVYQNHRAAYVDYTGRDRVIGSKDAEIAAIPEKIKEVFNGLISGNKPVTTEVVVRPGKKVEKKKSEFSTFESIMRDDFVTEIANEFSVSEKTAISIRKDLDLYKDQFPDKYKNYKSAWRTFVKKAIERNPGIVIKRTIPSYTAPVDEPFIPVSSEKMAALRQQLQKTVKSI